MFVVNLPPGAVLVAARFWRKELLYALVGGLSTTFFNFFQKLFGALEKVSE